MLNCPPAPEKGDDHGHLLIKTLSEESSEIVSGEIEYSYSRMNVHQLRSHAALILSDAFTSPSDVVLLRWKLWFVLSGKETCVVRGVGGVM